MTGSDPETHAGIVPPRNSLNTAAHAASDAEKNDPTAAVTLCHHEDDVTTASAVHGRGATFGEYGEEVADVFDEYRCPADVLRVPGTVVEYPVA